MNIKDLTSTDYSVVSSVAPTGGLNVKDLPSDSFSIAPSIDTPAAPSTPTNPFFNDTATAGKNAEKVADFTGGKQLAQGLAHTIANASGAQDDTIAAIDQGHDIQAQLMDRIKTNKAAGKDTTKLESALQQLGGDLQTGADQVTDLGTGGLSDKEVLGSGLQLAANFIPTGQATEGFTKFAKVIGIGGKAAPIAGKILAGAAQGYTYDVAQHLQDNGKLGKENFNPGWGTAIGAAAPVIAEVTGYLFKHIAGFLSGTGPEAIDRALQNPDKVNEAINKYAKNPEAKADLVDRATGAIQDFTNGKQSEYGKTIDALAPKEGAVLSKQPAIDAFKTGLDKFGVDVDAGGKLSFNNSNLTKVDETNVQHAWDKLNNWTDESPQGLDKLRQTLGNFMKDFKVQGNPRANVILSGAEKGLKSDLISNLPGYGDALTTYGEKSQLTSEVLKELQLGGKAKPTTQLKNILGLFKKDPQIQEKLVSIMGEEDATKFMDELSGAIMSSWLPSGGPLAQAGRIATEVGVAGAGLLAGAAPTTVGLAGVPAIAASSPKIVGKAAIGAGKAAANGVGATVKKLLTAGAAKAQP